MSLEKVLKGLETCTGISDDCAGHGCPYWDFDGEVSCRTKMELEALALLKEQNETIMNLLQKITEMKMIYGDCEYVGELVRCKDCKHGRRYDANAVDCEYRELATEPDWFCADGERKEGR